VYCTDRRALSSDQYEREIIVHEREPRASGKVKLSQCLTKHYAMKTYWGSGGIAPLILDLEVSDQLHAPAALPQGKSPWYPLDRRLGGPQSRSGRGGEEKNSQPPQGVESYNPVLRE
jgi:hypothetical protein